MNKKWREKVQRKKWSFERNNKTPSNNHYFYCQNHVPLYKHCSVIIVCPPNGWLNYFDLFGQIFPMLSVFLVSSVWLKNIFFLNIYFKYILKNNYCLIFHIQNLDFFTFISLYSFFSIYSSTYVYIKQLILTAELYNYFHTLLFSYTNQ